MTKILRRSQQRRFTLLAFCIALALLLAFARRGSGQDAQNVIFDSSELHIAGGTVRK